MDIKKALILIDLGYSAEEIKALENNQTAEAQTEAEAVVIEQAEAQAETQAEAQAETQAEAQAVQSVEDVFNEAYAKLNKQVEDFSKRMQSLNNTFAEMDADKIATRTDGDIIASIIKPQK